MHKDQQRTVIHMPICTLTDDVCNNTFMVTVPNVWWLRLAVQQLNYTELNNCSHIYDKSITVTIYVLYILNSKLRYSANDLFYWLRKYV